MHVKQECQDKHGVYALEMAFYLVQLPLEEL